MAIFKKKNKIKKEEPKPEEDKKVKEKVKEKEKEEIGFKKEPIAWKVLESPYISEKATDLVNKNKYIFKIKDSANKKQVKDAVEEIYKVNVLNVNITKIPRKKKRLGKFHGWKKGFKKAIIEIEKGQKIDIYPT